MTSAPEDEANGLGRAVHDYYARYADNADAKIGVLFGIDLALAGLLLGADPSSCADKAATWLGVICAIASSALLFWGIYPRVAGPGSTVLFWERVWERPSAEAYADDVATMSKDAVDREFAKNSFHVAGVLHAKFLAIRIALVVTATGLLAGGLSAAVG